MRVSRIVVSQTVQLRQYEPFHVECEVTLDEGETSRDAAEVAYEMATNHIDEQIRLRKTGKK
jgi:hypothetical protein